MRLAGKITGVVLILIAVPLLTFTACNTAIDTTLRAPETYADVLENETIFENLVTVALPAIVQSSTNVELHETPFADNSHGQLREIVNALDPDEWREVTSLLISTQWLQERTRQLVDTLLNVINGNLTAFDEPFDLTDVRQRLTGESAQQAAAYIIANAPECTQTQLNTLRAVLATGEGTLPVCQPGDELRRNSEEALALWFAGLAEVLQSDTPTVGEFMQMSRDDARALNLFFDIDRQGLLLLYLCPMALLALVLPLTVRSFKGFGRWIGTAFIIAGAGVIVSIMVMQMVAFSIVSEAINAQTEVEQFAARVVSEMTRSAFGQASGTMLAIGGLYFAVGFILWFAAWFFSRDDDDGELVLISEDGEIISTASQKRIGQLHPADTG